MEEELIKNAIEEFDYEYDRTVHAGCISLENVRSMAHQLIREWFAETTNPTLN